MVKKVKQGNTLLRHKILILTMRKTILKDICHLAWFIFCRYCDPKYAFPPQKLVIEFGVSLVEKIVAEKPKTLVVCGSYTIGKERIFTGWYLISTKSSFCKGKLSLACLVRMKIYQHLLNCQNFKYSLSRLYQFYSLH